MNGTWSAAEKKIARAAFDLAHERAEQDYLRRHASYPVKTLEDLWNLEDELREWRKELDGVSHYAYSSLMLTFAVMIRYGWLKIDDLAGLEEEKIEWFRSLLSDIL